MTLADTIFSHFSYAMNVIINGEKKDFDYRLETPCRAARAGMKKIGIGVCPGLSDWRAEGVSLGYHPHYLRKRLWQTGFTVSFPRLRPTRYSAKKPPTREKE